LERTEIYEIFLNWEVLFSVNSVLLKLIQERVLKWSVFQKVGDIFCSEVFLSLQGVYQNYITKFEEATRKLDDLRKQNPNFNEFITQISKDPQCKKLNLESFLIMPVQRLPRYELLLRDLIKITSKKHEDYESLCKGLESVQKVTTVINERQRTLTDAKQSIIIMQKLGHYFMENGLRYGKDMKLVREADVTVDFDKKINHAFLFTTRLLLVQISKGKYNVREVIILQTVKDIIASKQELHIQTSVAEKVISFKVNTDPTLADAWEKDILNNITSMYSTTKAK